MNLFVSSPQWIIWILTALLVAAAIQDSVQLRISNFITGAVLILGIAAMVFSGFRVELWENLIVFLAVLLVGTFLFSRQMLGGGDVKLFAAIALWVDLGGALGLIATILVAGGFLALAILFLRVVAPAPVVGRVAVLKPRAGIPYGVAIAIGTLIVVSLWRPLF